jgi:N-acetylmuramoyl-L-alanine amidase
LTRSGDYQLDPVKRASAANYHQARLFIAIHTGGGFLRQMDRWSVFYYNKDENQNHPPNPEPGDAADLGAAGIPWDKAQQAHQQESRDLAECIRSQLAGHPDISEVHVAGAPLRMLQGIDRPAIVIEAGYLTNPETENRLNDGEFLTDAARRIKRGIDVYLSR